MTPSVIELLIRTAQHAATFSSDVAKLATSEIKENAQSTIGKVVLLVAGLGVALSGAFFLLLAGISLLIERGWVSSSAYGLVGGAIFILGLIAVLSGIASLRQTSLLPRRAIREAQTLFREQQ